MWTIGKLANWPRQLIHMAKNTKCSKQALLDVLALLRPLQIKIGGIIKAK